MLGPEEFVVADPVTPAIEGQVDAVGEGSLNLVVAEQPEPIEIVAAPGAWIDRAGVQGLDAFRRGDHLYAEGRRAKGRFFVARTVVLLEETGAPDGTADGESERDVS